MASGAAIRRRLIYPARSVVAARQTVDLKERVRFPRAGFSSEVVVIRRGLHREVEERDWEDEVTRMTKAERRREIVEIIGLSIAFVAMAVVALGLIYLYWMVS